MVPNIINQTQPPTPLPWLIQYDSHQLANDWDAMAMKNVIITPAETKYPPADFM